jgi:outer membrane protein assembly factor BamE (lipoprotein component of BamABCDE complex)
MRTPMRSPFILSACLVCLSSVGLVGCTPIIAKRGNLVEETRLTQIQPGQTTSEQVRYILGTPSSTGVVDGATWYYIGRKTEQTAFLDPRVTEQRIVRIRFDQQGTVQDIKDLDGKDSVYIAPDGEATPTTGADLGFFEQLLSNLSRPPRKGKEDDKKNKRRR